MTVTERIVHGIDRYTQEHLCGQRDGIGTDSRKPAMEITCPLCQLTQGDRPMTTPELSAAEESGAATDALTLVRDLVDTLTTHPPEDAETSRYWHIEYRRTDLNEGWEGYARAWSEEAARAAVAELEPKSEGLVWQVVEVTMIHRVLPEGSGDRG